jgi:phenol hydroxylase P1 protein
MDQLGIAQYLTRLGLLLGNQGELEAAKQAWLEAPAWQPLRRYVEDSWVLKDWFELFVAQNVVLDGLLFRWPTRISRRRAVGQPGRPTVSMLTRFQAEWFADHCKWVDAVIKTAAAESADNKALLSQVDPRVARACARGAVAGGHDRPGRPGRRRDGPRRQRPAIQRALGQGRPALCAGL